MMTWNLLASDQDMWICGYHLKCWTQETQSPHTHTDTYIHVCEYRYVCVNTEAYVRYFPCLADLSLHCVPWYACNATHIWHWPSQNGGSIVPFPFDRYPQSSNYLQGVSMFGPSQSPLNHMDSKFNLQSIPNQPIPEGNSDLWGERHRETRGFPSIS